MPLVILSYWALVIVPALAVVFEFAAAVVPLLLLSVVDWLFVLDEDELVDELLEELSLFELFELDDVVLLLFFVKGRP